MNSLATQCRILLALGSVTTLLACQHRANSQEIRFNRDVRPILSQKCFVCHGTDGNRREADLRLDQQEGIRAAFKQGQLADSEAWKRVNSGDVDEQMPPADSGLTLSSAEKEILRRWILQGAKWEGHWAFIAPQRPPLPSNGAGPSQNAIDRFILATLQVEGVEPVGQADRATLIRRLSLDIVGLPPSIEQVDAFVADTSSDAYEKVVDRLLASEHFGERLAIYWLDLVRYADSVGYQKDSHRDCWTYRDWVITAFNTNKPYDEFVTEQLAGDLMTGGTKFDRYRRLLASGFNRMNQTTSEGGAQAKEYLAKYSADRVRNNSPIFLGITSGCAECHDHKYDPITTQDFYQFAAFFADIREAGVGYPPHTPMPTMAQIDRWEELERKLASLATDGSNSAERKTIEEELSRLTDQKNWTKTLITNVQKPRPIRVLPRGNWLDESNPPVKPAVPAFLGKAVTVAQVGVDEKVGAEADRATRLDLAGWITDVNNPLTARVFVNRLWRIFYGEGISRTLDDLGAQGAWPSHPELLDWLAVEFVESGWNIKHMVKLMVMSDAYKRSAHCSDELRKRDPENLLLARQATFRLPAELVRDSALSISGLLSPKMFGRSVRPYQPANYWYKLYKDGTYRQDHGEDLYRRGVYTYWRRSFWHPSLRAFDAPAREECLAQRPRSNTPLQSLVLLNDPTYVEAARVLATNAIIKGQAVDDNVANDRIRWMFRRAVARDPLPDELAEIVKYYERQKQRYADDVESAKALTSIGEFEQDDTIPTTELAAWTAVARLILNLHETITRP